MKVVVSFICFSVLIVFSAFCYSATSVCPEFDLTDDCKVDLADFGLLVSQWLAEEYVCDAGYEDCNGEYGDGCEIDVLTDIDNCGGCGQVCQSSNGTVECIDGICYLSDCPNGYANCDGIIANGCETNIFTDLNNCGGCDNLCSFDHAEAICQSGVCMMGDCDYGWADCNLDDSDGCEHYLLATQTCVTAEYIGVVNGDDGCDQGPYRTGLGERWYRVHVNEANSGLFYTDLCFEVYLSPTSGIDYDLYLYEGCGNLVAASQNSVGNAEWIHYVWDDGLSDDSKDLFINIKYYGGSGCDSWTLETYGDCYYFGN